MFYRVVPALGQPEVLVDLPREPLPAQLAVQTKGVHEGTAQFNNMSFGKENNKRIRKQNLPRRVFPFVVAALE